MYGVIKQIVRFRLMSMKKKLLLLLYLCGMLSDLTAQNMVHYPDSSVLSNGNWYVVNVPSDNIYKLTYNDFVSLGVPKEKIDFDNLSIFGQSDGAISDTNALYDRSDLVENAVYVNKQGTPYVLFYAKSTMQFEYNKAARSFNFTVHPYSDVASYFITFDPNIGEKKRIVSRAPLSFESEHTYYDTRAFFVHKRELANLLGSGRNWFGELFSSLANTTNIPVSLPNVSNEDVSNITVRVINQSTTPSSFSFTLNNNSLGAISLSATASGYAASAKEESFETSNVSENNTMKINFSGSNTAKGRLDYIKVDYTKKLRFNNGCLFFYATEGIVTEGYSRYSISNVRNANFQIWDVTCAQNPERIDDYEVVQDSLSFVVENDSTRLLYVFTGNSFPTPILKGKIDNQNLHAWTPVELVIVTAPEFLNQANMLADLHRTNDGISVGVATTQQVYNEFSSGTKDFLAIREFMRMLYNRYSDEGLAPKNLLLFGDGTFDNKNILGYNNNFIPTYQAVSSLFDAGSSYTTDDVLAFLSPYSKGSINDTLMIGIGRLTVNTVTEAENMVDKCERYMKRMDLREGKSGEWRNAITLTADDADTWGERYFIDNAEAIYYQIKETNPVLNVEKIYSDAYKQYNSSSGATYPDASKAINQRMKKGCLLFNYVGHGSDDHLSSERLVTITDITSWSNYNSLPLVITSTCEFTKFDQVEKQSAGEFVLSSTSGGGIALISASRKIPSRNEINTNLHKYAVIKENGRGLTFGEVFMKAKNATKLVVEERSFGLFGDPALRISLPMYDVKTTKINDISVYASEGLDTVRALSQLKIEGEIVDENDNVLENFNGKIYVTLLDKASNYYTLDNEGLDTDIEFEQQKNVLHKGIAEVKNGIFTHTITVPKDIAYNYGNGKLSYYAQTDSTDAAGYFSDFIIGGIDTTVQITETRPVIQLYMNDTNFVNGGITDENPSLFAIVSDKIAINTVGSGLGHDIMARLDNAANTFVLNDYFEADFENQNRGTITFPFYGLSDGKHTLTLKVWNIFNFSSDATITFVVNSSGQGQKMNLKNYPNPFSGSTEIVLEHNQPSFIQSAELFIYNREGRVVLQQDVTPYIGAYTVGPVSWNGCDEGGARLSDGIYFARMVLETAEGRILSPTQKLIIFN